MLTLLWWIVAVPRGSPYVRSAWIHFRNSVEAAAALSSSSVLHIEVQTPARAHACAASIHVVARAGGPLARDAPDAERAARCAVAAAAAARHTAQ